MQVFSCYCRQYYFIVVGHFALGCKQSGIRAVGNEKLWFRILFDFAPLYLQTELIAMRLWFWFFYFICEPHRNSLTNNSNLNSLSLNMAVMFSCSPFSQKLAFRSVWSFCDALRTEGYACRAVGMLCFKHLFGRARLRLQTCFQTIYSWIFFVCVCVSHGDWFTDNREPNSVLLPLVENYSCITCTQTSTFHSVWRSCNTLQT